MKIVSLQTFKHGANELVLGHYYEVAQGTGEYFVHNGWANALPDDTEGDFNPVKELDDATLDIDDAHYAHSSNIPGE